MRELLSCSQRLVHSLKITVVKYETQGCILYTENKTMLLSNVWYNLRWYLLDLEVQLALVFA